SYAVAADPGAPVDPVDVAAALAELRAVFAAAGKRLSPELVAEADAELVRAVLASGLAMRERVPLLSLAPGDLVDPPPVDGAVVHPVRNPAGARWVHAVAERAFGEPIGGQAAVPLDPAEGGAVLVELAGEPVAAASWTALADGVTEVVGVATLPGHRRRGLGALVTAAAVRAAGDAGATLTWLTPGDDGADRVYRSVGYTVTGTAEHLHDPP
ncbi:MAG: GNAT family N-acetyltransferase, partial [Actinobacteria bacterium]|nr:GNAT family N-acetyltransferase [Actinomycetota bacterium]